MIKEMLKTEIYQSYEIKLIEQINSVIVSLMAQQKFEQMAGAMMMAKAIIRFPEMMFNKDEELKARSAEAMRRFQSNFVRGLGQDD